MQRFSKDFVNKYVTMEDVLYLTTEISAFYQSNGYLTSYAFIPPQEVINGEIKIIIVESKIDSIMMQGNKWTKNSYLKNSILASNGISQDKVFDAKKLQLALKELNNQNYLKAQVQVSKNKDDATELILNIQERPPIGFNVIWDNFGRELTGRERANLILSYDNLTGHGDKIYGGTILAENTRGVLGGYELPVGKRGTKIGFDYSASSIKLGKQYKADDITGFSNNCSFRITQPIYKSTDTDVVFATSFDSLKSKTNYNSLGTILSDYKLSVFRTGVHALHDDDYGRWIGALGADFGAKFLGASPSIKDGPTSNFYNFKTGITRVQRLPKKSLAIARLNGQYSPNRLFAAEQMQLGGPYSLRGYEPGTLIGDWGLSGTMEVRTPVPGITKILPSKIEHWDNKIQWATFYDWGYVKDHNNLYGYPQHFLHSVGTGLHFYLTDYMSAAMNVGIPLGQKYYNENSVRLNFSINTEVDRFFFKPIERI